jgi:sugar phosphate isomerase/epimerase
MRHILPASCALLAMTTSLGCASDAPVSKPAVMASSASDLPEEVKQHGFAIGCQAWMFNHFSAFEAVEKTAHAGGKVIELFPGQRLSPTDNTPVGPDLSDAQIGLLKAQLAKHKVKAANFGVVGIPKNEAEARKIFAFAKKMGMYGITTESVDAIDTIEKLVKEFDIHVAFHEHPRRPNDPNYKVWDPNYNLSVVKDRDPRIGACGDVGHWASSNIRPLDAVKLLKGRMMCCHFKDRAVIGHETENIPGGTGILEFEKILRELRAQGFKGNISVEHEANWGNNVPEAAQYVGFVRGVGAMLDLMEKEAAEKAAQH